MTKGRKNSRVYAKIFEEWNKNRTPLTLNGEDFTYIPEPGEEFRQCYLADTKKNRQQRFYKARHANRLAYEWMRPGIIVANRIH